MPFHIDRFRGSPDVQAMHPTARWGYLSLLASAWQTDDCSLSADPIDLATEAGLTDDMWSTYGPRILRKFRTRSDGLRIVNDVLLVEWQEAKRIFESRVEAARRTTKERSPKRKPTVTVPKTNGDRDTVTGTETLTGTDTEAGEGARVRVSDLEGVARQIVCAHPRAQSCGLQPMEVTAYQLSAVYAAIASESMRAGTSRDSAAQYLLVSTQTYASAVALWPPERQIRAVGIEKFYREFIFREDPERWRHEDEHGKRNRSQERSHRNLAAFQRASGL